MAYGLHTGLLAAVALSVAAVTAGGAEPHSVSASAAKTWLRSMIPLPKEVKIARSVKVAQDGVKLTVTDDSPLGRQAGKRLQDLFLEKAGVDGLSGAEFEVVLGIVGADGKVGGIDVPEAARLRDLPNREQAYLIRPIGEKQLVLAALSPRGLFYAVLTLEQLLERQFVHSDVSIPLAVISDWPDLAERGLWGGTSVRDLEWLAEMKMNMIEFHSPQEVTEAGVAEASISPVVLRRGRANAVTMIPIISHINHLGRRGAYRAFPELRGKGEKAKAKETSGAIMYAPCASNPKLTEILAGWMKAFARSEGVRDICCWLGELKQHCECEDCAKTGQFALEARAFVKAWRLARKDVPDLRIRILLTQGSYNTNDKVLSEVPPELGVSYYDGGRTYDSSKDPMIYPLLEEFAAKGRWLGVYPQLTPSWRIESPWSGPQFVKARMQEFVDKKLTSLTGYVVIDNKMNDFNVTAAAEWSWNAHGRDEAEFARAWATRQGIKAVDRVAEWALKLGAAGWDIYGARLVERYFFRSARIKQAILSRAAPAFGDGMLRYIPDLAYLQRNAAECRDAVRLADQVGAPGMVAESRVIESYYRMLESIVTIQTLLSGNPSISLAVRRQLQDAANALAVAGAGNVMALRDWERAVRVGAGGGRFMDSLKSSGDTVAVAVKALERFGVRAPELFASPQTVAQWTLKDFREKARREMVVEITEHVKAPGDFLVSFDYTRGWNGLHMWRAALAESPRDDADARTDLSADEHEGFAGYRSNGNVYRLKLEKHDPAKRYWLVADVRGTRPQDQKPGRVGCYGDILLQREMPPDWIVQVLNTQPLSQADMPAAGETRFSGKGIRVGVITGGYGSTGLLNWLRRQKGIDAIPITTGRLRADRCQVIVYPQLRWETPTAKFNAALSAFVTGGGGLIATHDAVGYRKAPKLLPDVCKGGIDHSRGPTWKTGPNGGVLTNGLKGDTALTRGYMDQIELEAGPAGKVVAVSAGNGKPVAVSGQAGKGRYLACGLLLGANAEGDDAEPTPDEATLLLNAVSWCVRK